MYTVIAQVPIDQINDLVDTSAVTPWDGVWAIVSLIAAIVAGRALRLMVRRYSVRANLPDNMVDMLGTTTLWSIVALGVVVSLTFLGLDVAPLWILIIVLAAAFVVGGRSLLEAFGAGVLLQARSPFEPGDLVELGEHLGVVKEINSRVVIIDAVDGRRVFIPNQQVLRDPIVNLTHRKLRMSTIVLDVVYATDLDRACAVAVASLEGLDEVLDRPAPEAEVRSFEASSVRIALRFWHESDLLSEWAAVDTAARAAHRAMAEAGIEFAFPQATLWWGEDPQAGTG